MIKHLNYIDVATTASILNVSQKYIYELVRQRKIPFYKPFGKKLMFKLDELQSVVDASKVQSITPIAKLKRQANNKRLRGGINNG
jgi:excisionase family DNA binding protein